MLPFRLGLLSDCSETLEYPVRVRPPSKPFKIFSIFLFGSGLFLGHSETLVCPRLGRASFQVVPKFEYSLVWVGFPSRPFQNFSMPPFGLGLLLGRSRIQLPLQHNHNNKLGYCNAPKLKTVFSSKNTVKFELFKLSYIIKVLLLNIRFTYPHHN